MSDDGRTIGEDIEQLALLTDVPASFVEKLRQLFAARGVSLDQEVGPWREILEQTFVREAAVRRSAQRAREAVNELIQQRALLGEIATRLNDQLKRQTSALRGGLPGWVQQPIPRADGGEETTRRQPTAVPTIWGYLVRGPRETQ